MSDARNVIREALEVGDALAVGLQKLEDLTHLGGNNAELALKAVRGAIHALQATLGADVKPAEMLEHLAGLHRAVAAGDAETIAAIKARFAK